MPYWTLEHRGPIAIASYENLPMNYLVNEAVEELISLSENLPVDARVFILTGKPKGLFVTHFSVEALSDTAEKKATGEANDSAEKVARGFNAMTSALENLPIPVICVMTGSTMGGGLELALACDIRIVQHGEYTFGLPEARIGILPGGGGTQRLARLLGKAEALNMILRGMIVGPKEAAEKGIVHEVADDAMARALEIAAEMAALSPVSMREIKRAIHGGMEVSLAEGLEIEREAFQNTMDSEEAREAMKAFAAIPMEARGGPQQ